MESPDVRILAINGGSSSIRFALYRIDATLERELHGKIDRIDQDGTAFTSEVSATGQRERRELPSSDRGSSARFLMDWFEERESFGSIRAVGHRIVHGMRHTAPKRVTPELLEELGRISPYDSEHMPGEIEFIRAFQRKRPKLPQIVCFDTEFHRDMPRVAAMLALPRRYEAKGLRRYGFHGLSYAYMMEELVRLGDPAATSGRVILAHLGNGASLAAVHDGTSIDTSMGFTPTGGITMSTRSGDLDPGVAAYLARTERMDAGSIYTMVNRESGMLGVSEISGDMRDLLGKEREDTRAAEAVALFCYQAKKCIGSFAAALGGVDTLVFAGGIGENAPVVRERICDGLRFLGIALDSAGNSTGASQISSRDSRVAVRVIHTDEELMIAKAVVRELHLGLHRED